MERCAPAPCDLVVVISRSDSGMSTCVALSPAHTNLRCQDLHNSSSISAQEGC